MEFLRENILKIVTVIIILGLSLVIFTVSCGKTNVIRNVKSYSEMENNLLTSTKKYMNSNRKLLPKDNGKITKVNMDTLINSNYIKEQSALEDENVKCSGYTEVINKSGKYIYVPYIKCGKYYETKTISKHIIETQGTVVSEDGLYKYEDIYVYRGENPNNYLKLGERIYRIIEINSEGELKLISTKRYDERFVWDDRYNIDVDKSYGINDYSKSRLKDSLEKMIDDKEFFSNQEIEKIIEHDVCIGKRNPNNLSISMQEECSYKYPNQRIGMLNVGEYFRVSTDSNCNTVNNLSCTNYNYLNSISTYYSTMTGSSLDTYNIITIQNGKINLAKASRNLYVYPVVYIDRLSIYLSGDGSLENPYTLR